MEGCDQCLILSAQFGDEEGLMSFEISEEWLPVR